MESGSGGSSLSLALTASLSRVAVSVSGALEAGCTTTPPRRAEVPGTKQMLEKNKQPCQQQLKKES